MSTSITETLHRGGFIISELEGYGSRTLETVISGQNLTPGTVLGRITASGKMTILAPGASDGSQHAAGILFDFVDATAGDVTGQVVIERSAEVRDTALSSAAPALNQGFLGVLVWPGGISGPQMATAVAELLALGISVRYTDATIAPVA
jgi:hypothetical protein